MLWPETDPVLLKPTCLKSFVVLDEITSERNIFSYSWFQGDMEGVYCGYIPFYDFFMDIMLVWLFSKLRLQGLAHTFAISSIWHYLLKVP